jgi:hypothetical protein
VKVAFEKLFNWLAFLLSWNDIDNTRAAFKKIINDVVANAQCEISKSIGGD